MYAAGVMIQPSKGAGDPVILHRYERGQPVPIETKSYESEKMAEALAYAEKLVLQNSWIQLNEYSWQESL